MDTNPAVHPGAPDINNGIDDDCDKVIDPDKDSDGYAPPQDCQPNNPKIHPGAPEVRGNKVDENCDKQKAGFQRIQVSPVLKGSAGASFIFTRILFKNLPKGAAVKVTCKNGRRSCGSVFKVRRKHAGNLVIQGLNRSIPPGSTITALVTKRNWIGSFTRWKIKPYKARRFDHCVNVGQSRPPSGKCKKIL